MMARATVALLSAWHPIIQVQGREGFPVKYNSVWHCAYQVVKEEGIASFWHGSMCSFMKVRSAEA